MRIENIQKLQNRFFIGLVLLTTLVFFWLIADFFQPVFWAAVLAILFRPVYRRLRILLHGHDAVASVLTIILIVLLVILPLFGIGLALVREASGLVERVASGEVDVQEGVERAEQAIPAIAEFLEEFGVEVGRVRQALSSAVTTGSQFLASQALQIGQDALRITVLFFLTLYFLFFLLKDGDKVITAIIRALPLGDRRERRLFSKFAEVSRATIKGTLVVGVVQGALGGLAFWALGIRAAVFWGIVMTVLSLLPAVGAAVVWVPAVIILIATGSFVKGLILLVLGTFVISLVDNILRPILVGRDTKMPDYLILLATLGGLTVFGISGFVVGPIIASLFLTVWVMFQEEHGGADNVQAEEVKEAAEHSDIDPEPVHPDEENGPPAIASYDPAPVAGRGDTARFAPRPLLPSEAEPYEAAESEPRSVT